MAGGVISNLSYAVGFKIADSALRKADKQTEELTKSVVGLGSAAVGVGIAIAGIAVGAMGFASRYESAMSQVQMATGSTVEQMEATREIATDLYNQNFGESWSDLGQSISAVQQITGQTGDELKGTAKNALLLREAMGIEVAESVRTANTLMKQFGVTSDEAYSLMAQGKEKGLDFSGELLDTINEYSNQFKALGFDANSMFDTLAVGSKEGAFNLDKVGDAVKEFNIRAKDSSKTTTEAFEMLGLNADEMMQTFAKGGPAAKNSFSQIIKMIGDIKDPVSQNTVAVNLFGTQFEDLEKDVIAAMGAAESQFDMTIDKMGAINQMKMDSPSQALGLMGRQIETGLLIPLGEKLLPYLQQFSVWLQGAMPQIEQIGGVLIDSFAHGLDVTAKILGFLVNNFDILGPAIAGFATVILIALVPALWASAAAGWAAMAPWLPIIGLALLVAAAIVGLVLVFKNWGAISDWISEKWTAFKDWTLGIFKAIGNFFKQYWPYALALLTGPLAPLVMLVIHFWDDIKAFTVSVFTSIGDWLSNKWSSIVDFFKNFNMFEIGKNMIEGLIKGISSMATAAVDKVKDIGSGIVSGVKGLLGIKSPSRVMMEVGFFTGEGLAEGIAGTQHLVSDASEGLAEEAESPYTAAPPTLAPAAAQSSAGAQNGRMQLDINLSINLQSSGGNASSGVPTSTDMEQQIKQVIQDAVQSAIRRMGLSGGVS